MDLYGVKRAKHEAAHEAGDAARHHLERAHIKWKRSERAISIERGVTAHSNIILCLRASARARKSAIRARAKASPLEDRRALNGTISHTHRIEVVGRPGRILNAFADAIPARTAVPAGMYMGTVSSRPPL